MGAYTVSLLKAYWGDAATPANDFCFDYLPRISGDHGTYQTALDMCDGKVPGFIVVGENPAVGSANGPLQRRALATPKWLVVRDLVEIETASFWYDSPGGPAPVSCARATIATEVFLLPAASHVEKEGSFTNTQRLLQWHDKAVEPEGDCRSDLWFYFHLGRLIREKLAARQRTDDRDRPRARPRLGLPVSGALDEPSAEAVLREINGWGPTARARRRTPSSKDDGSTTCGCWIYCGCYADETNQADGARAATSRRGSRPSGAGPGRRTAASSTTAPRPIPTGRPWSERKRYVWWDAEQAKWTGEDVPDFQADKRPDYVPPDGAKARGSDRGHAPVHHAGRRAWLAVRARRASSTGRCRRTTSRTSRRSRTALYAPAREPARQQFPRRGNRYQPSDGEPGAEAFPFVFTTYRLTEHHTAGGMSRSLPYLAELQPEMFCEVSPELARRARARARRLGDDHDPRAPRSRRA